MDKLTAQDFKGPEQSTMMMIIIVVLIILCLSCFSSSIAAGLYGYQSYQQGQNQG